LKTKGGQLDRNITITRGVQKNGGISITSRTKNNISVSALIDPNDINVHFKYINTDCNYKAPDLCVIPEGTKIPTLSINMVEQFLQKQQRTAAGPDDLPYWFWKNFSLDLAPVITTIFNRSLMTGIVPNTWKKQMYYHCQRNLRPKLAIN
jgi:hypothetical protein